jgi:hypothetical protein
MTRKRTIKAKAKQASATETPPAEGPKPAKTKRPRTSAADVPVRGGKLSALEAAARLLGETGQAMNCQEMIAAMAAKGYWTSPGGKTPWSTLYSALLREVATKGKESRFVKVDRGRFALRDART